LYTWCSPFKNDTITRLLSEIALSPGVGDNGYGGQGLLTVSTIAGDRLQVEDQFTYLCSQKVPSGYSKQGD